jgi:ankyrin repeat protein
MKRERWVLGACLDWGQGAPERDWGRATKEEAALSLKSALSADDAPLALACLGAGSEGLREDGSTPLGVACSLGSWRCVRALLERGAPWDEVDERLGDSPIRLGAHSKECSQALMESARRAGQAHLAAREAALESLGKKFPVVQIETFLSEPEAFEEDAAREMAMEAALGSGECAGVRLLLERGWDPEIQVKLGGARAPALGAACEIENWGAVEALLGAGAKLGWADWAPSRPPLSQCVAAGRDGAVRALLDAGADPNERDHEWKTPLMSASDPMWPSNPSVKEALVEALLSFGADPSLEGGLARHWANKKKVSLGWDALDWALARREPTVLEALCAVVDPRGRFDGDLWVRTGQKTANPVVHQIIELGCKAWDRKELALEEARQLEAEVGFKGMRMARSAGARL